MGTVVNNSGRKMSFEELSDPRWRPIYQGKVRQLYLYEEAASEDELLMVASDRISAYDAVLPTPIPDKGRILTQMSVFWFGRTQRIVPNHLISEETPPEVKGRALRVQRLDMFPVECVVRGYLTGSGWREYQESGSVCGIELPAGLRESDQLPEPIFTPATKAEQGEHDENIDLERMVHILDDRDLAIELQRISTELYLEAAKHARARGILLADTKFEFGSSSRDRIVLGDEVLTPDSSRFWPADDYVPGQPQASFDKQFVRDWLDQVGWNRESSPPPLPDAVVEATREKYIEAFERITGHGLGQTAKAA
jgi:phosphoribosylaminoimidazole-succinocarboxamide synthase